MASSFLLRHGAAPPLFTLVYFGVLFAVLIGFILWDRRYQRAWQQFRARNWRQVAGKLMKAKSSRCERAGRMSSLDIRLGYDYKGDGEETEIDTLPFSGEFPTEEEAEMSRRLLAHRSVMVRVSPRNPKHSCILDDDVRPQIATASK
ncbi:MAG TPA: DUF3592 domain-containing protein [Chthoniobacterales bacterium]|jgi:hypothetical protein|nr:DUF3592 domain-containing protein [Chthoniobacterales bacterium]